MSDVVGRPPDGRDAAWRRRYQTLLTLLGVTGIVLVLLLIALGIWWRGLQEQRQLARSLPPSLPRQEPTHPLPVAVVTPRPTPVAATIRLPVRPGRPGRPVIRQVTASTAGRVLTLARPGTRVEAGQIVARVVTTRRVAQRRFRPARVRPSLFMVDRTRAAGSAGVARPRAVGAAQQRLERAEQAVRTAGAELAAARQAPSRREARRQTSPQEVVDAEAALARAHSELTECESALRVSERLYRAGAASRAELNADAAARAVAAGRLSQAQARVQTARAAPSPSPSPRLGPASAPELTAAKRQLARARREVASAREALRIAMQPLPSATRLRPAAVAGAEKTLGWKQVVWTIAVRSPVSGVVTRWSAWSGSQVPAGASLLWIRTGSTPAVRVEESRPRVVRALAPSLLSIPGKAVLSTPEGSAVWVARRRGQSNGTAWTAHRQVVQVSRRRKGTVLISKGLEPDSRVIVAGIEQLREGQAVAAIPWRLP
jgi:biotin carboxyl carrier protein